MAAFTLTRAASGAPSSSRTARGSVAAIPQASRRWTRASLTRTRRRSSTSASALVRGATATLRSLSRRRTSGRRSTPRTWKTAHSPLSTTRAATCASKPRRTGSPLTSPKSTRIWLPIQWRERRRNFSTTRVLRDQTRAHARCACAARAHAHTSWQVPAVQVRDIHRRRPVLAQPGLPVQGVRPGQGVV